MNNFIIRFFTSLFLGFVFLTSVYQGGFYLIFIILISFIIGMWEIVKIANSFIKIIVFILFIIFLICFFKLRLSPDGLFLTLWCLVITWLTDTSAYIFGATLGKKKINFISPNKTYIGFVAGLLFPQISYFFLSMFMQPNYSLSTINIFLVQFATSGSVLIGDLLFSFFKRVLKIKDYSNLIPGHGGFFDRIDGLIFSTILFYILIL